MFVLGLQGSPRKNGNTNVLLSVFMEEAEKLGAVVQTLYPGNKDIKPCKELKVCEAKGCCPIDDDMQREVYPLLWQADLIVMATPVFFYNVPAQLKALIDRSQTQWARKNILKLEDPGRKWRKGFVLALGATKGANLFEGLLMTAKYFFDAIGAHPEGSLTYRRIEDPGDIERHPAAFNEVKEKARELVTPGLTRKRVLFACRENSGRSQMAQAFASFYAGDRIEAESAGDSPAEHLNMVMVQAMEEKGIDMAFRKPKSFSQLTSNSRPDTIVTMGCEVSCPVFPGAKTIEWDLPDPAGKSIDFIRNLRDEIEKKVREFITEIV